MENTANPDSTIGRGSGSGQVKFCWQIIETNAKRRVFPIFRPRTRHSCELWRGLTFLSVGAASEMTRTLPSILPNTEGHSKKSVSVSASLTTTLTLGWSGFRATLKKVRADLSSTCLATACLATTFFAAVRAATVRSNLNRLHVVRTFGFAWVADANPGTVK